LVNPQLDEILAYTSGIDDLLHRSRA
jgi:hypothetical protein